MFLVKPHVCRIFDTRKQLSRSGRQWCEVRDCTSTPRASRKCDTQPRMTHNTTPVERTRMNIATKRTVIGNAVYPVSMVMSVSKWVCQGHHEHEVGCPICPSRLAPTLLCPVYRLLPEPALLCPRLLPEPALLCPVYRFLSEPALSGPFFFVYSATIIGMQSLTWIHNQLLQQSIVIRMCSTIHNYI